MTTTQTTLPTDPAMKTATIAALAFAAAMEELTGIAPSADEVSHLVSLRPLSQCRPWSIMLRR